VIQLIAAAIGVASVVASGVLADRFGRRKLLGATSAGIGIFAVAALPLLNGGAMGETAYLVIGFILLGLAFAQASGVIASNFAQRNRYTASAITSDLAWLFGAGFAPLAALWLSAEFGLWAGGVYLLSGTIVTLMVLRWNRSLAARNSAN